MKVEEKSSDEIKTLVDEHFTSYGPSFVEDMVAICRRSLRIKGISESQKHNLEAYISEVESRK